MRKNQVTIKVMQVLPDDTELGEKIYEFEVYADANNIFEALSAANFEVFNELHKGSEIPSFGRRGISILKDGTIHDNFGRGNSQIGIKGYEEKTDWEKANGIGIKNDCEN